MRAVQLGADVHCEIERGHGPIALRGIRKRYSEIAAEADKCLGPAIDDCLHRGYRVMAMHPRRFEAEHAFDPVQHGAGRLLGNPDRAVPSHIAMTPQWAEAGAGFSDVSAYE